ncbi:hypothetical protein KUCAC02_022675 [Chaenocephalus aceratus]|uniref:Uncharacterized protein n=1 Tax=Chaenocephalus aceratus TaxID=36190 RepID=A0ACB9XNV3_CHAAC|nr:hypothetical protein KUCAC02_022675 [Chaenocephalus aceratus]
MWDINHLFPSSNRGLNELSAGRWRGSTSPLVWFKESQVGAVVRNGVVPEWFHGIISRNMSEELLMSRRRGYFLIRVSESRIGYTLSCR